MSKMLNIGAMIGLGQATETAALQRSNTAENGATIPTHLETELTASSDAHDTNEEAPTPSSDTVSSDLQADADHHGPLEHDKQERVEGVALALGGGVSRGWAHIGVLRAFDEAKIPISMIAGTSIGALAGGCYLAGKLDALEEFARSLTKRRIFGFLDFSLRGTGLISGVKLAEQMREHMDGIAIEDLDRPFVAVATEIRTGNEVWMTKGPLIDAMRASYALPGIFEPIKFADRILTDGALVNPVPVSVCRTFEAPIVVAVNLGAGVLKHGTIIRDPEPNPAIASPETDSGAPNVTGSVSKRTIRRRLLGSAEESAGLSEVLIGAYNILQDRVSRSRLAGDPPDFSINPKVGHIGLAEFHRADEAIQLGYESAKIAIEELANISDTASL